MQTMVRTQIAINGTSFYIAQGTDIDAVKEQIEDATLSTGKFVSFTVVGNRAVSVLTTPHSEVALSVETVQLDLRDNGEESSPFGGHFDSDFEL